MKTFIIDVAKLDKVRTKKLTFKGQTQDLPVYRVPINQLFYNNLNGRISTFISRDIADGVDLNALDINEYNNRIANYIKQSSKTLSRFKKTKEDIRNNTQKEVGVVLTDGRVIDGNRRFTCLRELFEETGDNRFAYFEAVVLPAPSQDDLDGWKQINSLELELQIGTDEKVDYNAIDWLVKVYFDLVKNKSYTIKEYARLTKNKYKESDINKMVIKAELMEDFLDFFNKPEQFYLAKTHELDGPLSELANVRKKIDDFEWNRIKSVFYIYLYNATSGDRSREIRRLVKIIHTSEFEELVDNSQKIAEKMLDGTYLKDTSTCSKEAINITNTSSQPTGDTFGSSVRTAIDKTSAQGAMNKPITCCTAALKSLNDIDNDIVDRWKDESTKNKYKTLLSDLEKILETLKLHVS